MEAYRNIELRYLVYTRCIEISNFDTWYIVSNAFRPWSPVIPVLFILIPDIGVSGTDITGRKLSTCRISKSPYVDLISFFSADKILYRTSFVGYTSWCKLKRRESSLPRMPVALSTRMSHSWCHTDRHEQWKDCCVFFFPNIYGLMWSNFRSQS